MKRRLGSWAGPIAALVALTFALAGTAPAVAAEIKAPVSRPKPLTASANATVAAMAMPAGALAQAAPAAQPTDTGSKSFFKTPAGRIALVAMAAGTGFMVYSAFHDNNPVKSQFR